MTSSRPTSSPSPRSLSLEDFRKQFEQMAKLVRPEDFEGRMVISSDPDEHRRSIQEFADLGFDRIYLHNVGRNQREWIDVFAEKALRRDEG